MKNTSPTSTESVLQLLGALGVISSALAFVFSKLTSKTISTELISFILIIGIFLYVIYVYLRMQRNAPFPFPKFFWQIFFNRAGASHGKYIDKIRIAVLSAPDGFAFAEKLAESDLKPAYKVELAKNDEAEPEAYSSEKILIDLKSSKPQDEPTFHHLLKNVQGAIIIWTDGWLKYPWAIKKIGDWAIDNPKNPLAIAQLEDSNFPDTLNWVNFDKVGINQEEYIQKNTPTGLLLRQASSRHQRLQNHSKVLWRNSILLLTLLLLSIFTGYYYYSKLSSEINNKNIVINEKEKEIDESKKKLEKQSAISSNTINYLSSYGTSLRKFNERTVVTGGINKTQLFQNIYDALSTFEAAIEYQLNANFDFSSNTIEVDVFFPKENSVNTCLCESTIDTDIDDVSCFKLDKGIVTCSYRNNWIVHWEMMDDTTSDIHAWELDGTKKDEADIKLCSYSPDSESEIDGKTKPEYKEILCFPVSSIGKKDYFFGESNATVCVSLPRHQGLLGNTLLHNKLLILSQLLHPIPWEWYIKNSKFATCK